MSTSLPNSPDELKDKLQKPIESTNAQKPTLAVAPIQLWQICIREFLALTLWFGLFFKLFIVDFDRWFINAYMPSLSWVLDFRFGLIVVGIGLVIHFWRHYFLWRWIGYILFYPLIIVFWKIPVLLFKSQNWTLGIAILAVGADFFKSFKVNFLVFVLFTVATIICGFLHIYWLLVVGMILVATGLLIIYWRTLIAAFRPTLDVFSSNTLDSIWKTIQQGFSSDETPDIAIEQMTKQQQDAYTTNLQTVVLYNRACYFLAGQIRTLKKSNLNVIVYISRLFIVFFATAWTFFLLNFSLFKIEPSNYVTNDNPSAFTFYFYAFNTLFSNSISDIEPVSVVSQSLSMVAVVFLALFFTVFCVFIVTSILKSRDDSHLDETVTTIQTHAESMEPYLDEHFGMNVTEAVAVLQKTSAAFIGVIYYLSPSLKPDNSSGSGKQQK